VKGIEPRRLTVGTWRVCVVVKDTGATLERTYVGWDRHLATLDLMGMAATGFSNVPLAEVDRNGLSAISIAA
jgi:hypothetical protein